VLGVLAGIIGTWQASEALKLILGIGNPLVGRLLLIDALDARIREVKVVRDPDCPVCGDRPTIKAPAEMAYERPTSGVPDIEASELDEALSLGATLLDVREPHEAVLGTISGAVAIPASQLEARLHELDSARRYVVACRVGARSVWAIGRLRDAGFGRLAHLRGGLLSYAARNESFDFF
jgi:adenylyltransferase/sulfurtransferase